MFICIELNIWNYINYYYMTFLCTKSIVYVDYDIEHANAFYLQSLKTITRNKYFQAAFNILFITN